MTIQEVIQLHRAKAISSVKLIKKLNHRHMVEISVTATVRAMTPQQEIVQVPFSLDHHALVSELWTMRMLDDNGIPFEHNDLTVSAKPTKSRSPQKAKSVRSNLSKKSANSCKNCTLCGKTELGLATGCYNPSVFSPADGDWICNVNLQLSQGVSA
jgi:hypothetical protein